jgi:phage N-6-adenine-methyltransferase
MELPITEDHADAIIKVWADNIIFSSKSGEWSTPQDFFDTMDKEFSFDLDAAATEENKKCPQYLKDALSVCWSDFGKSIWCNPPYGRGLGEWFKKAREASERATVVMLVPARTDVAWFHDHVYHVADEIRFIRGRLKFGGQKNSAPFPSMLIVYGKRTKSHTSLVAR